MLYILLQGYCSTTFILPDIQCISGYQLAFHHPIQIHSISLSADFTSDQNSADTSAQSPHYQAEIHINLMSYF